MFRQNYQDIYEEQYKVCCCGHVRKVASIIALFFIIRTLIAGSVFLFSDSKTIFGSVLAIAVHILVLVGDKRSFPGFYLPALIFQVFNVICCVIFEFALFGIMVLGDDAPSSLHRIRNTLDPPDEADTDTDELGSLVFMFVLYFVQCAFSVWCSIIFYRTWKYLRREIKPENMSASAETGSEIKESTTDNSHRKLIKNENQVAHSDV
ncbi:hypothetical protein FO519_003036 [Halicephalobus sp. NKZ332]|nr:hypothetical protein FO519_003036 [Halicephalobus sp. NKZ332]